MGCGKTSFFQLPKKIQNLVENGVELGEADDEVFGRKNSKHKDGAVGILTGGLVDRTSYYKEAVVMSLIPFINNELSF
jgi:non-canonical (house-cleaning) NTP pyrophosphatase